MVGSVNKVILLGNLGRDPEIRSMQSGNKMASFSIATSKRWKDKSTQEQREKTSWHNIVVFGEGLVDIVEKYVKKGSKIYCEGELQTRKWQDQDGNDKYTTEVVIQGYNCNLTLLDSRGASSSSSDSTKENKEIVNKVVVTNAGDSEYDVGDVVLKTNIQDINKGLKSDGKKNIKTSKANPATFRPLLLGITRASLNTESFLSAASFAAAIPAGPDPTTNISQKS